MVRREDLYFLSQNYTSDTSVSKKLIFEDFGNRKATFKISTEGKLKTFRFINNRSETFSLGPLAFNL